MVWEIKKIYILTNLLLFRLFQNTETPCFDIKAKRPKQTSCFGKCLNQFRLFRYVTSFGGHPSTNRETYGPDRLTDSRTNSQTASLPGDELAGRQRLRDLLEGVPRPRLQFLPLLTQGIWIYTVQYSSKDSQHREQCVREGKTSCPLLDTEKKFSKKMGKLFSEQNVTKCVMRVQKRPVPPPHPFRRI